MFVSQNSHVEALITNLKVGLWGGKRAQKSHEGGAPMVGLVSLSEEEAGLVLATV